MKISSSLMFIAFTGIILYAFKRNDIVVKFDDKCTACRYVKCEGNLTFIIDYLKPHSC